MLRSLLLTAVVTAVGFAVAEGVVRLLLPPPGFVPYDQGRLAGLVVPHPELGYTYARNYRGSSHTSDYGDYEVTTNELGLRDDPINLDDTETIRVLAVGDSYTAGQGVRNEKTWPECLERILSSATRPRVEVVNAGVSGYSVRQMRQLAEALIPVVRPRLIIAGVYGAAYGRVTNPFVPFHDAVVQQDMISDLVPAEGGFLSRRSPWFHPTARSIDLWLLGRSHFGAHLSRLTYQLLVASGEPSEPQRELLAAAMQPMLEELGQLHELAKRNEVMLVVLLVNRQEPDGRFKAEADIHNAVIGDFCREERIPVVDPLSAFRAKAAGEPVFRLREDTHWSPLGHQLAAELLLHTLEGGGLQTAL